MFLRASFSRFVPIPWYVPPDVLFVEQQPADFHVTDELKNLLSRAAGTCNRVSLSRRDICLGAGLGGDKLSSEDFVRLSKGMEALSTAILRIRTSSRPVDFEVEAICDCDITVDHLASVGIRTLADIFAIDSDVYREALLEAESNGAARQYHMLALTRSLH